MLELIICLITQYLVCKPSKTLVILQVIFSYELHLCVAISPIGVKVKLIDRITVQVLVQYIHYS